MRTTGQLATAVLAFLSLLLTGCGGGGCSNCVAANPTPTITPTPSPTPTPTSAVVWKQALPPVQGANMLSLVVRGSTILGAGVNTPSGTGTNAYAASFVDNGTSTTAATPTSLSDPSDILGMTLIDPTTAFAVGSDTQLGSTTAVPTVFALNPANGAFLSVKPFGCGAGTALASTLANATDATSVTQDGTTMFVALRESTDVPAIIATDSAGNIDCSQTAIRVTDVNVGGIVHAFHVSGQNIFVAGDFNGIAQGFVVRLDKGTGVRNWLEVAAGITISSMVIDDANGFVYAGGTKIATRMPSG
jgi:hypothetical protein